MSRLIKEEFDKLEQKRMLTEIMQDDEKDGLYLTETDKITSKDLGTDYRFVVSDTSGFKESEGKLSYELDFSFITQLAERNATNKHKYEPYNWKEPIDIEELKQSLIRHVIEVMEGNYEDAGRERGHLEAIALNAMFINYQLKVNLSLDKDQKK